VDCVISIERQSERIMIFKIVLDDSLLNVLTLYVPHKGNWRRKRKTLERVVPFSEMKVVK